MKRLLFLMLMVAGFSALTSCGGKKKEPPPPTPVNMVVVHKQPVTYYDLFPGNVVALSQVDLHAEVEGYVTGIFFKEGDHVKRGQKLYELDQSKYQATVNQSKANLKVAESNLDQAQKDADRYIYLNKHDAVAKQTLDHALTTLQNSKDQVTSARQDLVKAETDLRFSVIVAPFDGTIGLSQVKLGTLVSPGQTVLNTISTDDPMAVDFVVNEKQVGRFIQLQALKKARSVDSLFTIVTPDGLIYSHSGDISVIDRGVDPQTGTIKIRLNFPNPDFQLRAGMSCKVRVKNDDTAMQMLIPSKAIVEQMGEYFVFIAKDTAMPVQDTAKGKKGGDDNAKEKKNENNNAAGQPELHAFQRKVFLGQTIDSNVIVRYGLNDGETVITEGTQKLRDGARISNGKPPANGGQQGNNKNQ